MMWFFYIIILIKNNIFREGIDKGSNNNSVIVWGLIRRWLYK